MRNEVANEANWQALHRGVIYVGVQKQTAKSRQRMRKNSGPA